MKYVVKKFGQDRLLGQTASEVARADMMSRVHDSLYDRIGKHYKNGEPKQFALEIDVVG